MENIIPVANLSEFVAETIANVSRGVELAREQGILAELPKEVNFNVTLVSVWQSPDHILISTDSNNGIDGTTVTEERTTDSIDDGTSNEKSSVTSNSSSSSSDSGESTTKHYTIQD